MKYLFVALVLILLVLHQDYWQWGRSDLIFGFLPYPLAYHMVISMVTAAVWLLAVNLCWPSDNKDLDAEDLDPEDIGAKNKDDQPGARS